MFQSDTERKKNVSECTLKEKKMFQSNTERKKNVSEEKKNFWCYSETFLFLSVYTLKHFYFFQSTL